MSLFVGGGATPLSGDVTGQSNANTVVQLSGAAGVVAVLAAALTFGAAVAAPAISQAQRTDNAAGQTTTIAAQAAKVGSASSGGNLALRYGASDGVANKAQTVIGGPAGDFELRFGNPLGDPTAFGVMFILPSATVSSATNFAFLGDGSNTIFNAAQAGGTLRFRTGNGGDLLAITSTLASSNVSLAFTGRTAVSAGGDIRGPKDFLIGVRNSTNTSNLTLVGMIGTDTVQLGDSSSALAATNVLGGGTAFMQVTSTVVQLHATAGSIVCDTSTYTMRDGASANALVFSLANGGATQMTFDPSVTPTITQGQATLAGVQPLTIRAQAAKAASGAQGGALNLSAGASDGAAAPGLVNLQSLGVTLLSVGASGANWSVTSLAVAAGTTTLTQTQYANPFIVLTGTITGAPAVVVLPNQNGSWWFDCSQLAGTGGLQFKSGTATSAAITTPLATTAQIVHVSTVRGANTIAINV